MSWRRQIAKFLRIVGRRDDDLDEEMRTHLEMEEEENVAKGMTRAEARYAARRTFGNVGRAEEESREMWVYRWWEIFWQDVRYGMRVLLKSPGFTAVAILTLALGIGANTAIFTIVYGVLLRPLSLPEPERIYQFAETYKGETGERTVTATEFHRLQQFAAPFEYIAGYTPVGLNLTAGNEAEHLGGMHVSADYFGAIGVWPEMGRNFSPKEDQGGGERVAIISHELWSRRFGADRAAMGRTILLNGDAYTVIGVMPAGFEAYGGSPLGVPTPDVWLPLALIEKTIGSGENIGVIVRLKRNATQAQLQAQMAIYTQDYLKTIGKDAPPTWGMMFLPYQFLIGVDVRPFLLLLLGAIGFVLLIACANVANLLLARGGLRGREIAVRVALGASKGRLMRQLLTESMLIALGGGILGLALAAAALGFLLSMAPGELPRAQDVHLDRWVFAFTFGISMLTGLVFGLLPAASITKTNLNDTLKEGASRVSAAPGRARLRQGLVAGEFAMSLVLLTGAGLMIATFGKLMSTDPGFDPHRVLSLQFWLVGSKYDSTLKTTTLYRSITERLESLPDVEAAAVVAAGLPLERGGNNGVKIAGFKDSEWISADYREITPDYFKTLGIPLKQGRVFTDADSETSSRVVIVNEAFVRRYLAGGNALGQHLYVGEEWREVAGIVGDVKSALDQPAEPTTFIPTAQAGYATSKLFEGWFPRTIVVRTKGKPLGLSQNVRDTVATVDPLVPTGKMRTMDQVLSHSLAMRSFMMLLLSIFGGLAVVLASVGVYGLVSYAVSQRTREIGLRMALGASRSDVLKIVLAEGLKLVLIGLAVGVGASLMLTKLLEGMVYGVNVRDPLVFALVNLLLIGVSLLACFVPARRATRVDPMTALRYE